MYAPIIMVLVFILVYAGSMWKIFAKAGEPGWYALIPIYNMVVFFKIIGKPWWWMFLVVIPVVNWIFVIWSLNMLSHSFGKDSGFTALLFFFNFIFLPVLGFGSAAYKGPYGDPDAYAAYQARRAAFDFERNIFHNTAR